MTYNIGVLSRNKEFFPTNSLLEELNSRDNTSGIFLSTPYVTPIIDTKIHYNTDALFAAQSLKNIDGVIPRIGRSHTQIGLIYLKQLELIEVPTTISSEALYIARDKFRCYQALYTIPGIKLPRTIMVNNTYAFEKLIEKFKFPVVIKIPDSSQGTGTILAPSRRVAQEVVDALILQHNSPVLIQEYLYSKTENGKSENKSHSDIRVLVVGKNIVGAMRRIAPKGQWRTNYAQGAECVPYRLTEEVQELVLKIVEQIGIEVSGIDLYPTKEGLFVLEVNACPGWKAFEQTYPKINVAKIIIDYLLAKIKK
ncbi:MAG: ATP-grasp domain-containing protein [Candidatus Hodarchaeales archaeon]